MTNIKKNYLRGIVTVASFLWLVFIIFHILLTGKIAFWNLFGSLPTFFFGLIPLIFLAYEIFQRERRERARAVIRIMIPVLSFILGTTQLDINLFPVKATVNSNQAKVIKVFNWNTCYWDQFKNREQFYRFLVKQKADIYVLQEYLHDSFDWRKTSTVPSVESGDSSKRFSICSVVPGFSPHYLVIDDTRKLAAEFPGYQIRTHLQFVLLSRFPILKSHVDYSEQYAVFDVDIGGRLVRFFNVHMLLHVNPQNPFQPEFYTGINQRFLARSMGFTDLKTEIKKTKVDYFIAGDFNSTKAMGVMNDLLKSHVDGIKYSNEVFPLSFEFSGLRLWRFDYGLALKTNHNLGIQSARIIGNEGLSDHNPQVFVLNLKNIGIVVNEGGSLKNQ